MKHRSQSRKDPPFTPRPTINKWPLQPNNNNPVCLSGLSSFSILQAHLGNGSFAVHHKHCFCSNGHLASDLGATPGSAETHALFRHLGTYFIRRVPDTARSSSKTHAPRAKGS